ncbi:MAG: 3-hydroxybutyryl-CoA dehydratase [Mycobacterium sp.]|jgi:3-hydroxybutyryl-CoA dehydratase|nr:3-hydroxybutyryl-CoA dehydratase [Mycobacterium sp.]
MITGYYEDLNVGQEFETGGRTITESYVLQFAMLSGDWHPLHTDAEYARANRFGAPISHGMLTLAVATGLMTLSTDSVQAFYGMDRVRFLRPVFFGDTIHLKTTITEKASVKDGSGLISVNVEVLNQRGETVMAAVMKFVVRARDLVSA